MFGSWVLHEIWIIDLSSALVGMLMRSSKLFQSFFERSSFKLRCETVIGIVPCYSHQACCLRLTICAKLTMAFTFTSLPLNFNTSVSGCGCGFGFEQKCWRVDGFGEKKTRIGGFAYPYSPLSFIDQTYN